MQVDNLTENTKVIALYLWKFLTKYASLNLGGKYKRYTL